ncbi:MAG: hypothetical protein NVSMB9_20510 [Isosphaeraceae bacterium]
MGLDLALGGLVLFSAIRGWLKGFVLQAIRLVGLVASVYGAVPVRETIKPYVVEYLPTVRPELIDRLLWWVAVVVSYVVMVGVASLLVAVSRRQTLGLIEPDRGDQFAGFGLGMVKGLVLASFVVAGLQKYGQPHFSKVTWVAEQSLSSYSWEWNERYHPAARLWATPPVQEFVSQIQRMGLNKPARKPDPEPDKLSQTSRNAPKLLLADDPEPRPNALEKPAASPSAPGTASPEVPGTEIDLSQAVDSLQNHLDSLDLPE